MILRKDRGRAGSRPRVMVLRSPPPEKGGLRFAIGRTAASLPPLAPKAYRLRAVKIVVQANPIKKTACSSAFFMAPPLPEQLEKLNLGLPVGFFP